MPAINCTHPCSFSASRYSPYGYLSATSDHLLAFNGERRDPFTGCYHLGNGHRVYSPSLMRFHSPDKLSPFDIGGLNAYAYCLGDPINHRDPTGKSVKDDLLPIMLGIFNVLSLFSSFLKFKSMWQDRKLTSAVGGSCEPYRRIDLQHPGTTNFQANAPGLGVDFAQCDQRIRGAGVLGRQCDRA
ncbi:RHS repeat-associated core domain-containing protein [Pseudomonas sp. Teo4]|uniref:RHS repeat-associated core domain-containing protein n=1 Tax=Pseudomonas sp. Teo4 TaxID=3064528 RepID=UPI002ABC4F1A|nr:RHS repeat-associated core domain-containing protein [Pseudomonas sp. Teo4]MDZ3994921.1 hypothetical protein [Pseudomonas sp. Teo4]